MIGIAASTKHESLGLVTTIIVPAPMNSTRLRKAIETDAPTADLIWVVSAVSRDIISPVCERSKKAGDKAREMAEHLGAQIRDNPFAERGDEIEPKRARHREHEHDRDHHREIFVDQPAFAGKAEIDHAAHRDRHGKRCKCRQNQRAEGRQRPQAIAQDIGQQQSRAASAVPCRPVRARPPVRRCRHRVRRYPPAGPSRHSKRAKSRSLNAARPCPAQGGIVAGGLSPRTVWVIDARISD